jgi:hypothetical protein
MKNLSYLLLSSVLLLGACKDNKDDIITAPTTPTKYVLLSRIQGTGDYTSTFEKMPEGAVNNTTQPTSKTYTQVRGGVAYKKYLFDFGLANGGNGFSRMVVGTDGTLTEQGNVPTVGQVGAVAVLSDTKGYFVDANERNIKIFNPTTLAITGTVDMSRAFQKTRNQINYYTTLYLRGDRMYACLYTGSTAARPYDYRCDSAVVAVVNTSTDTYLKDTFYPSSRLPGTFNLRCVTTITDESGNLYIPTLGGLGYDLALGATASTPGKILKIPAGSDDFDRTYEVIPQNATTVGAAQALKTNFGFFYAKNGIAYTTATTEASTPTQMQLGAPVASWIQINLTTKQSTLVAGLPKTSGFYTPMGYFYEDKALLPVYNNVDNISGMYNVNVTTGTTAKQFDITAGGIFFGLYRLEL